MNPLSVTHDRLFVFAGAGMSLSTPAGLPQFPWIRDELLKQLDLAGYVPPRTGRLSEQQEAARGLAPEPFILALRRSRVHVLDWLRETLSHGASNAAHAALAQLAQHGAAVWTVNFDELIESAAGIGGLKVSAWPHAPAIDAQLLKPHGTLTGELIADSEQVLLGVQVDWQARLRADGAGRTVIFVGYSGRDLDSSRCGMTYCAARGRFCGSTFRFPRMSCGVGGQCYGVSTPVAACRFQPAVWSRPAPPVTRHGTLCCGASRTGWYRSTRT